MEVVVDQVDYAFHPDAGTRAMSHALITGPQDLLVLGADPIDPERRVLPTVAGNTAFAFDLYHAVRQGHDNVFFSPYSISAALALAFAGARGITEGQMTEVLHFHLPQGTFHRSFAGIMRAVEYAARPGPPWEQAPQVELGMANALWGQVGHPFEESFLSTLEDAYGAPLHQADFTTQPEQARQEINRWVADKTHGKIQEMLGVGGVSPATRLLLTNAIHFLAGWARPFNSELTVDAPFHRLDGSTVEVPMMTQCESLPYEQQDGVQVIELPYWGRTLSMVIILPEAGAFEEFESQFTAGQYAQLIASLAQREVRLYLPRFKLDHKLSLARTLEEMGMPEAFDPLTADFSGMDGTGSLFIDQVIHQAVVEVDEEGTEAAAATVVGVPAAMVVSPVTFRADRPFIFFIRDNTTQTLLFMGRVMDPS
ncbi:MAG: serpin family protein [Candidatus Bipolaricaulaceae bacterium]